MTRAVARAVDLLLPAGCVSCRAWMPRSAGDSAPICARCRSRLRIASWPRCVRCHAPLGRAHEPATATPEAECHECRAWPPALASARSAFVLTGPAADLVHALKYEGWCELAGFMGEGMAKVARRHMPACASGASPVVTPVPTTPTRVRRRGYNQAALLADAVASVLGAPLAPALVPTADRRSQIELEPGQRRANVRGVFAAGPAVRAVQGCPVLLVDDVLTTGATASEAASVLLEQGASAVHLMTFARALPEAVSGLS